MAKAEIKTKATDMSVADIKFKGNTTAFWDKIVDGLRKERPGWADQRKPTEIAGAQ